MPDESTPLPSDGSASVPAEAMPPAEALPPAEMILPPAEEILPSEGSTPTPEWTTHGVGPWPGGEAAWPDDPRYDRVHLRDGDTRNVVDRYRYWTMEAIVADLDTLRFPFHVAIENWQHDLNIGSIVRSANAFAAETVHIIGRRRWNKRGAMVTDRYQHVVSHPDVETFVAWAKERGIPVLAIDNVDGSVAIETFDVPRECVFLFGQEGPGLSDEAIEAADAVLEIAQFGSTRSINASAAAAIVMHDWVVRHAGIR